MRYEQVNATWPAVIPPITRLEAERAARKLYAVFGGKEHGEPWQRYDVRFMRVRRCWITAQPNRGPYKGWHRLVHDISHDVARARQPKLAPHAGGHAYLEKEMVSYVVEKGWLNGTLRPRTRVQSPAEKRGAKLKSIEARLAKWRTKQLRAKNAIAKLEQQRKRLTKLTALLSLAERQGEQHD